MKSRVTRGYGLLEGFLQRQRSAMADKLILPTFRKGRILDIGCGAYSLFLKDTDFEEKYGVDKVVSDDHKEKLLKFHIKLLNIDFEKDYLYHFNSEYFDVITMLAVFEHIEKENIGTLLKEVYRVLKPGGMYIITTPAGWTDTLLRLLAKLRLVSPVEIEEHKYVYDHYKISSLLKDAGFSKENLKFGYFEVFMNIWVTGTK